MTLGAFIKTYREKHRISQRQFALACGLANGYISMLESEINPNTKVPITPNIMSLKKIANAMGISLQELILSVEDMPVELSELVDSPSNLNGTRAVRSKRLPMLGNVACGEPIFASEQCDTYVDVESDLDADFCLTAQGDSMINARIFAGDILFVKKQSMVNDGDIAVVLIEDEATVKRVYYDRENNIITLISENPMYKPMRYEGTMLDQIRILGKVVAGQYPIK